MDTLTGGFPFGIQRENVARELYPEGALGEGPKPLSFLEIDSHVAAWIFSKSKKFKRTIEFTPLESGPGNRVVDENDPNWDGSKFVYETTLEGIGTLFPSTLSEISDTFASDDARREKIRGYSLGSWQLDTLFADPFPGAWAGVFSEFIEGKFYNVRTTFEQGKAEASTAVFAALNKWDEWVISRLEQAQNETPQNVQKIAEWTRQKDAVQILIADYTTLFNWYLEDLDTERSANDISEANDRFLLSNLAQFVDSILRAIESDKILENFSNSFGNLSKFRSDPRTEILKIVEERYYGNASQLSFTQTETKIFEADWRKANPYLEGDFTIGRDKIFLALDPISNVDQIQTEFEKISDEFFWTFEDTVNGDSVVGPFYLTGSQVIGPVNFGLQQEACIFSPVKRGDNLLPPGTPQGVIRGTSGELPSGPGINVLFGDVFNAETGSTETLSANDFPADPDGNRAYAFKSPYITYSGDPDGTINDGPLREFWQPFADNLQENWSLSTYQAEEVGTFFLTHQNGAVLATSPLFTQFGTVGALNVTLQVFDTLEGENSIGGGL